MTTKEIEMRKVVKEMLSDVGINRETLKQAVKFRANVEKRFLGKCDAEIRRLGLSEHTP